MKILPHKQGSEEWLAARAGIITASELGNLLTPLMKHKTGETPKTYLYRKLAEKWQGFPLQSFGGGAMEQGSLLESEAIPWYEVEYGVDVERVGLVLTDDGKFGASPDGLLSDRGIEVKCPQPHTHIKWWLDGVVPEEHLLQCHGGMFATGYKRWDFISYCRGFPPLVRTVEADPVAQDVILGAVERFYENMDEGWKMIVAANGGEPKRDSEEIDTHPFE